MLYSEAVMAVSLNISTSFRFVKPSPCFNCSGHPLRARLSAVSSPKDVATIRDDNHRGKYGRFELADMCFGKFFNCEHSTAQWCIKGRGKTGSRTGQNHVLI